MSSRNFLRSASIYLLKVLLVVLPFHAFLITFASKYLLGSTQDNLPLASFLIASWKEILMCIIALLGIFKFKKKSFHWLYLDTLIVIFIAIHLMWGGYQVLFREDEILQVIWGLRTNLEGLFIFWIIRLFSFSKDQIHSCIKIIIISTSISLLFGGIQLVLPCEDLSVFGYTPYKSSWVSDKPLPCFHGVGKDLSVVRVMGTFAGPNQLSSFLLMTIFFTWYALKQGLFLKYVSWFLLMWQVIFLFFTYSRGAILGLVVALGVAGLRKLPPSRKGNYFALGVGILIFVGIFFAISPSRLDSSLEHIQKPLAGIQRVLDKPFGYGVGLAGPVSQRFPSDGSKAHIAENWYIQIFEEIGIIGGIILIILCMTLLHSLYYKQKDSPLANLSKYVLLALVALIINNVFLHTFASDISTTMLLWLALGLVHQNESQIYQGDQ